MDNNIQSAFSNYFALTRDKQSAALLVLAETIQNKKLLQTDEWDRLSHELFMAANEVIKQNNLAETF